MPHVAGDYAAKDVDLDGHVGRGINPRQLANGSQHRYHQLSCCEENGCTHWEIEDGRCKHGKDDSVPAQLHRIELAGKDAESHGHEKGNSAPPYRHIAIPGLRIWSGILLPGLKP